MAMKYRNGDIISWKDGRNHFVGSTTKIATNPDACAGLGVDIERKITFDMNTSGRLSFTDGTKKWSILLAKRSKSFCIDAICLFCGHDDSLFADYLV